MQILLMIS